jgi:hypothetical protein
VLTANIIRQQLYQGAETKNLDYKQGFDWNACDSDTRLGFIKDVLGMSNAQDGGVILIGVADNSYQVIGVTDQQSESFDQTRLADAVRRYSDPCCGLQLYKLEIDNKNIIAVEVREFKDVPHLCKMDANSSSSGKSILRRGALYVRTDRATTEEVNTVEEMRNLLGRALKARGDSIVSSIRALLAGSPLVERTPDEFERQINESAGFFGRQGFAQEEGKWKLTSYPVGFERERIGDPRVITTRLQRSAVSLRGWSFPRIRSDSISNFNGGVESSFSGKPLVVMHKEAFRAYQSGLFAWQGVFWEDGSPLDSGKKDMTFINGIWQMVEFFLFLSRYYEFLQDDEGVSIQIEATGLQDRELTARDPLVSWDGGYVSKVQSFTFDRTVRAVELKASPLDLAAESSRRLLLLFNWNSVTDQIIRNWQQRLLNRTY